ncbi:MAG TPA: glycosyltransferase [Solirubrobacteraceae bacterium]|jgi:glycosyltransferase involved in cell wall biosynthesis|nr:glycosyltransferase [Solirubrobacteraceae bacterium]
MSSPSTDPEASSRGEPATAASAASSERGTALLCISQSFAPATTPTGIRAGKLVERLAARWDVTVLTETPSARSSDAVRVVVAPGRRPRRLLGALHRLRLSKLVELLVWPDESIFWALPAITAARRVVRERRPSAIVVFMMPYSTGLVGLVLRRLTGLPLLLNLDDSPTCTDMHPSFPSRLHYLLARKLEDRYARAADAIVYVSETNLENVRARQPEAVRERFHLVRYGADERAFHPRPPAGERFEIVYVGAMSGWWTLIGEHAPTSSLKDLYSGWMRLGRHTLAELDTRTASPAVIGEALLDALARHPEWDGRLRLNVYDNSYPRATIERALAAVGIERVIAVHDAVAHDRVAEIIASADLLFLTLPRRADGSRGGRISAKTYEYLMTDRPILAALPRGENWDYLEGMPGVWLAAPDDVAALGEAVRELAAAKFAGRGQTFGRERVHEEISYARRAEQFDAAIRAAIARSIA